MPTIFISKHTYLSFIEVIVFLPHHISSIAFLVAFFKIYHILKLFLIKHPIIITFVCLGIFVIHKLFLLIMTNFLLVLLNVSFFTIVILMKHTNSTILIHNLFLFSWCHIPWITISFLGSPKHFLFPSSHHSCFCP